MCSDVSVPRNEPPIPSLAVQASDVAFRKGTHTRVILHASRERGPRGAKPAGIEVGGPSQLGLGLGIGVHHDEIIQSDEIGQRRAN